jgi:hypothetical protein
LQELPSSRRTGLLDRSAHLRLFMRREIVQYDDITGAQRGLILNFNVSALKSGVRRVDHPDRYTRGPKDFSFS